MDKAELEATLDRLDDMARRCDALIKRKPLQLDNTRGHKRLTSDYEPVACGPLVGREMPIPRYYRNIRAPQKPTFVDVGDGSIESIFADFEAQFDEMAQAHRG